MKGVRGTENEIKTAIERSHKYGDGIDGNATMHNKLLRFAIKCNQSYSRVSKRPRATTAN